MARYRYYFITSTYNIENPEQFTANHLLFAKEIVFERSNFCCLQRAYKRNRFLEHLKQTQHYIDTMPLISLC